MIQYLQDTGQYENTIIVHVADHGELLHEHGRMEHAYEPIQRVTKRVFPGFCENYRLFEQYRRVGHLTVLPYDELIHVPVVLNTTWETGLRGSTAEMVETIVLMSTIADLVGLPFETQGDSMREVMRGSASGKDHVFVDTAMSYGLSRTRAVRSEEFKMVRNEIEWDALRDWDKLELPKAIFSVQ